MSRSARLLDLLELLRGRRFAVTAEALAGEMDVSVRTIYRDIATLQAQGAPIEGEAGIGYVLKPGFTLPPLMFSVDELEALVLGVSWVADRADANLAAAARRLVSKVGAVLPPALRRELEATTLLAGPSTQLPVDPGVALALRQAVRSQHKVRLVYRDGQDSTSERVVWPFGLGYFDSVLMLMAWCELRGDFRHFRADRMAAAVPLAERYPQGRRALLEAWRIKEGLEPDDVYL